MKIQLINIVISLTCLFVFVVSSSSACNDINIDCDPSNCNNEWNFKYCAHTCQDCDGIKFLELQSKKKGSDCVDATDAETCQDYMENTDDEEYGCKNPKSELSKLCRKSCGHCVK